MGLERGKAARLGWGQEKSALSNTNTTSAALFRSTRKGEQAPADVILQLLKANQGRSTSLSGFAV
jgi:hypothetical protein